VSSQNNVGDDEYVEQYQKYDVRYHVCFPIACVEWTLYACIVAMSIDQSELKYIFSPHPHSSADHPVHPVLSLLPLCAVHRNMGGLLLRVK